MTTGYINKTCRRYPPSKFRKLSDDQVDYVRKSDKTLTVLAKELGVSHITISNIRRNFHYKTYFTKG